MNIEIIKTKRKTLAIQVIDSETVRVRAPYRMSKKDIQSYLDKDAEWIKDKIEKAKQREKETEGIRCLSALELDELADKACAKGNLNFNVALMRVPLDILDYVVVHELCHRLYLNHSQDFWDEVAKVIPDYKLKEKWLKENGARILAETRGK